jgi:hypothetical protein
MIKPRDSLQKRQPWEGEVGTTREAADLGKSLDMKGANA